MIAALAVLLTLAAEPFDPERVVDFEVAAALSHPERFSLCVAMHPSRIFEVDLCPAVDRGVTSLSGHVFARRRWTRAVGATPGRGITVGLGGGLGARVTRFCPFGPCSTGGGPEALLSLEGVFWLRPSFGLTLQLDAGIAVVWSQTAPGLFEPSYRVPARLLFGVAL